MIERASVTELFSPDELLMLMQFDFGFNAPINGLIDLIPAPSPYGVWSTAVSSGPALSWEMLKKMSEEIAQQTFGKTKPGG